MLPRARGEAVVQEEDHRESGGLFEVAGNGEGRRENGTEMRAKQKRNQNGRNPAEVRRRGRQKDARQEAQQREENWQQFDNSISPSFLLPSNCLTASSLSFVLHHLQDLLLFRFFLSLHLSQVPPQ